MIYLQDDLIQKLTTQPRHWLVTGSAGFIGSHLLEVLLRYGQTVTSLDNFSTGHQRNLDQVRNIVGEDAWKHHRFIQGDIADPAACESACQGVEIVLHQAALGSVPRSIADPAASHRANATGFLNMLIAARNAGVTRFVYAASSSTYGDSPALPKVEDVIGNPLSPYAVTKYLNELYAQVFYRCYGFETVGLRYFNVFGPRQDPNGAYAAVIPRWIASLLRGEPCTINGDGDTSRDFCFVGNAVQANLRAGYTELTANIAQIYNVAVGERTKLVDLHNLIGETLLIKEAIDFLPPPNFAPFRTGDVRHSLADIEKARQHLSYTPTHTVKSGMIETVDWYTANLS